MWGPEWLDGRFYLDFVEGKERKIAYAASFGVQTINDNDIKRIIKKYIEDFSYVSIRETNCWEFEQQALRKIRELFEERDVVVMAGGSMMYIDAVCKGIDEMPTIDDEVRASVKEMFERDGIEASRLLLKKLDPEWYARVDLKNGKRVMHALEVCLMTGKPYSSFLTRTVKEREFNIVKIGLNREREELFDRINRRVDIMVESGMEEEARALYPLRHLNALNTVGYKEWFDYFDGKFDREEAIRLIKRNTRRYAKKQLTWYRNDSDIHWFHPSQKEEIRSILNSLILD